MPCQDQVSEIKQDLATIIMGLLAEIRIKLKATKSINRKPSLKIIIIQVVKSHMEIISILWLY